MKVYEFVFLVLGIISLFDYVKYSIFRYKWAEIIKITGEPEYVRRKRLIEFIVMVVAASIFLYKIIF